MKFQLFRNSRLIATLISTNLVFPTDEISEYNGIKESVLQRRLERLHCTKKSANYVRGLSKAFSSAREITGSQFN